jgi:hypothetical protein
VADSSDHDRLMKGGGFLDHLTGYQFPTPTSMLHGVR